MLQYRKVTVPSLTTNGQAKFDVKLHVIGISYSAADKIKKRADMKLILRGSSVRVEEKLAESPPGNLEIVYRTRIFVSL